MTKSTKFKTITFEKHFVYLHIVVSACMLSIKSLSGGYWKKVKNYTKLYFECEQSEF